MLNKEQILECLKEISNENNEEHITSLIEKIENMDEAELIKVLNERKIKTLRDVRKVATKKEKQPRNRANRFKPLNELVSFGITGKTIHIHVIPKDARHMLTRDGMKKAELSLIDATEKIKTLIQTDARYAKLENVYAVSGIISGPVARWFKNIGYDVKILPIEEARTDKELGAFYSRFKDQRKLGRAVLSKEQLMSTEWESKKNERKSMLEIKKENAFNEELKQHNATDEEIVAHSETGMNDAIKNVKKYNKEEI